MRPSPSTSGWKEVAISDMFEIQSSQFAQERGNDVGCHPAEARAAYEKTIALDSAHIDAHVNLGRLLHEDSDPAAAEKHYRAALAADPAHAVAAFNLVSTLVMTVTDKQADIAILRTLGASPRSIMLIFMVQGAASGIAGTVGGVAFGLLVAFNIPTIVPFIERVAYKHSLKEVPLDVPSQVCITRDNTQLQVDGILYFQVTDAMRASYGSSNYVVAITQLCQTTLRSVIGKMELDKTFEERDMINGLVVNALDDAASNWGVKVLRYEIKDLTPPAEILRAMQAQITAEREKRALIAASEGRRQEQINIATGQREASIARSEGEKQAEINKAQGEAAAIVAVADATADAIRKIAEAIRSPGGEQAVQLKVAEKAVEAYAQLAQKNNTMIVPGNMSEVSALIGTAMALMKAPSAPPR